MAKRRAVYIDDTGKTNYAVSPGSFDLSPHVANLQGHWKLNSYNGITADSSPNGYTLSATGSPSIGPGRVGVCYRSVNTSNRYHSNGANLLIQTDLTFGCWMRIRSFSPDFPKAVIFTGTGATQAVNTQYSIQIPDSDTLRYSHEHGAGISDSVDQTLTGMFGLNQWFSVIMSRNNAGTGVKGFVQGVKVLDGTAANPPDGGGSAQLEIASTGFFDIACDVQEAFVINAELTEAEIAAIHNSSLGLG